MIDSIAQCANTAQGSFASHALVSVCTMRNHTIVDMLRLREIRQALGLTLEQVAERAGKSVSQMSRWESGASNIPSSMLPRLAQAYECSVQDIFAESEVLVVGYVGAGGEVVFVDDHEKGAGLYTVPPLPGMTSGMIGLEVRGQSMWPLYRDGTVLFIRRETEGLDDGALGDLAVVRLADGRTLVKELRPSTSPARFDLMSLNAPPIEGVEILWATPVRGALTRAGRAR